MREQRSVTCAQERGWRERPIGSSNLRMPLGSAPWILLLHGKSSKYSTRLMLNNNFRGRVLELAAPRGLPAVQELHAVRVRSGNAAEH